MRETVLFLNLDDSNFGPTPSCQSCRSRGLVIACRPYKRASSLPIFIKTPPRITS
ncbi:hypothetical protein BDZ94DRAFT_1276834 [Collybia nuda]|uniref:Uncharacterized protein n=1 Tax=Collybia nuda TaxID=64659 RepID=A0A9P5XUJ7_9AGAR|nr:hypothetical protein BDZ94DRAFT_1276834 [Collybia nuda]